MAGTFLTPMEPTITFNEAESKIIAEALLLNTQIGYTFTDAKSELAWYRRSAIIQRIKNTFDGRKNRVKPKAEAE